MKKRLEDRAGKLLESSGDDGVTAMMNRSSNLVPLAMAIACVLRLGAAGSDQVSHDLSQGWKFKLGDHASWSDPNLDDEEWRAIPVGSSWQQEGFSEQDGYAWYRLRFWIPRELQEHRDYQLRQAILLNWRSNSGTQTESIGTTSPARFG